MTNQQILEIFEDIFFEDDYVETSRLHSPEFMTTEDDVVLVALFGGLNGWGDSKDYLYDLYELLDCLESNGVIGRIVNFAIDALDDVFKVEIELRDLQEFYKGRPE